jgi:hypothetical protein
MPQFREYDQGQGVFRSVSPNELLEPDHPARVIDNVVEMLGKPSPSHHSNTLRRVPHATQRHGKRHDFDPNDKSNPVADRPLD